QVVAENLELPLAVSDLGGLPHSERESRALDFVRQESARPFVLATGPLVRAALVRLSDHEHLAIVTMHHAISDGWSIGILIRELSQLYRSFVEDEPPSRPELPIQYADYAVWQRSAMEGPSLNSELEYWTNQLAGVPALELHTDRPGST